MFLFLAAWVKKSCGLLRPSELGMPELLANYRRTPGEQEKNIQEINLDPLFWGCETDLSLNEHETMNLPWIGYIAWKMSSEKEIREIAVQASMLNWKEVRKAFISSLNLFLPGPLQNRYNARKPLRLFMKTVIWERHRDEGTGENWSEEVKEKEGIGDGTRRGGKQHSLFTVLSNI